MTETPDNNRKIKGLLARALLRANMRKAQSNKISEQDFKSEWTARREEFLALAGLVRTNLKRQGYDLVERAPGAQAEADLIAGNN